MLRFGKATLRVINQNVHVLFSAADPDALCTFLKQCLHRKQGSTPRLHRQLKENIRPVSKKRPRSDDSDDESEDSMFKYDRRVKARLFQPSPLLSAQQRQVLEYVEAGDNVFFTGSAGKRLRLLSFVLDRRIY